MNLELSLKSGLSPMYITSSNMVIPIINVTTSHMSSIINIIKNNHNSIYISNFEYTQTISDNL